MLGARELPERAVSDVELLDNRQDHELGAGLAGELGREIERFQGGLGPIYRGQNTLHESSLIQWDVSP